MAKKNKKDIDDFEYRAGKVTVSGKSGNPEVMELAKTEQLNGLILRYGWLAVGIIAVLLKMYEVTAVVAVTDYLKSIIFKLR